MTFNFDESFKKQLKIELDTLISCNNPYIVKCYNVFLAVISFKSPHPPSKKTCYQIIIERNSTNSHGIYG